MQQKHFFALLIACILCVMTVLCTQASDIPSVLSPDGTLSVSLSLDSTGALQYSVTKEGNAVLAGTIGMTTSGGSYTSGLVLTGTTERRIDETVGMRSGSYKTVRNHANEMTLQFANNYSVTVRAYNDGMAFRQNVSGSGTTTVSADNSTFEIPAASDTWAVTVDVTDKNTYERNYTKQAIEAFPANAYFPLLYNTGDVWCLLTEADIYTTPFSGSYLTYEGSGSFRMDYAKHQNGVFTASYPFSTPWRTVIVGDLATMVENTMVDALTEAADGDWSWVETGVAAWSWVTNGTTRQDEPDLIKSYIDLAAEMGWEFYTLDEGFQPHAKGYTSSNRVYDGFYDWMPEIAKYAEERGVKLIAWLNRRVVDTDAEVDFLEDIKNAGFYGIKVDFFDSESQTAFEMYNRIVKKCAEVGLVVNLHGTNKPTGERMTYPNVIAKEAIRGDEHKGTKAEYTTAVPFLRGALGAADFTPSMYPYPKSDTTVAHQAALATLIECGMLSMASSPAEYYASPLYWYYYDLPTHWDDLHFISGYPQEYTVLARRSGETWYVSAVTNAARTVEIPLDFLGAGNYNAAVYGDNADGSEGVAAYLAATAQDTLSFDLLGGGAVMLKLVPASDVPAAITIKKDTVLLGVSETKKIEYTIDKSAFPDLVWESSDESVVKVINGRVTGVSSGWATVTVKSAVDETVADTVRVHVFGGIALADAWEIGNLATKAGWQPVYDPANHYKMTMDTHTGELGYNDARMPYNVWLMDAPEGDFTATVKITGAMTHSYNSASLGIYADNTSVVQMARRFHGTLGPKVDAPLSKLGKQGNIIDFMTHTTKYTEKYVADPHFDAPLWMRVSRVGDVFHGYYSYDGVTFTEMPDTITNEAVSSCTDLKIALACHVGTSETYVMDIDFEDLTVDGEKIPFTKAVPIHANEISLADVLETLRVIINREEYLFAADLSRNGKNDLLDVLRMLKNAVQ